MRRPVSRACTSASPLPAANVRFLLRAHSEQGLDSWAGWSIFRRRPDVTIASESGYTLTFQELAEEVTRRGGSHAAIQRPGQGFGGPGLAFDPRLPWRPSLPRRAGNGVLQNGLLLIAAGMAAPEAGAPAHDRHPGMSAPRAEREQEAVGIWNSSGLNKFDSSVAVCGGGSR